MTAFGSTRCYGETASKRFMPSISEREWFITLAARVIPKWLYGLLALLRLKDEIGGSNRAVSYSVHRREHEGRVCHSVKWRGHVVQRNCGARDAIRSQRCADALIHA